MQFSSNLTGTINQLKNELQKEASDIQAKETAIRNSGAKKLSLETAIKSKENEIRQKELEIQKLKSEIQQDKTALFSVDSESKKFATEITVLKRDQAAKLLQLQRVENELQDAIRKSNATAKK